MAGREHFRVSRRAAGRYAPEPLPYGSTADNLLFAGKEWEISIDTDQRGVRVHDGATPGGHLITPSSAQHFDTRAAAVAANIPAPVDRISLFSSGVVLTYRRDASGTALTTNDGAKWSPADPYLYPDHWAENTTPGTTDMSAALEAAIDFIGLSSTTGAEGEEEYRGSIKFLANRYRFSSQVSIPDYTNSELENLNLTIEGAGMGATVIVVDAAENTDGWLAINDYRWTCSITVRDLTGEGIGQGCGTFLDLSRGDTGSYLLPTATIENVSVRVDDRDEDYWDMGFNLDGLHRPLVRGCFVVNANGSTADADWSDSADRFQCAAGFSLRDTWVPRVYDCEARGCNIGFDFGSAELASNPGEGSYLDNLQAVGVLYGFVFGRADSYREPQTVNMNNWHVGSFKYRAIKVHSAQWVDITGGEASGAHDSTAAIDIELEDVLTYRVEGNVFNGTDSTTRRNIVVQTGSLASKYGQILNNTYNSTGTYAVDIASNATNTVVAGLMTGEKSSYSSGMVNDQSGTALIFYQSPDEPIQVVEGQDDGANPTLGYRILSRSASPADNDYLGTYDWVGINDAGEEVVMASLRARVTDVTDGTEDSIVQARFMNNGTETTSFIWGAGVGVGANPVAAGSVNAALGVYVADTRRINPQGAYALPGYTTAELEDITHAVNTTYNDAYKTVINTNTFKHVSKSGAAAGAVWKDATGATVHTPV